MQVRAQPLLESGKGAAGLAIGQPERRPHRHRGRDRHRPEVGLGRRKGGRFGIVCECYDHRALQKILIANRGEIAVRIIRACRDLGLASVAVFSDERPRRPPRPHGRRGRGHRSQPAPRQLSPRRHADCRRPATGADAVHPGYGFLAENAAFAAACDGRRPDLHRPHLAGDRADGQQDRGARGRPRGRRAHRARHGRAARRPTPSDAELAAAARRVGYPDHGQGRRRRRRQGHARRSPRPDELSSAVRAARSESGSSFGDSAIYFERRLIRPRHIEVQMLADQHGTVLPFVERECSIQRRHQKVIEETPSMAVSPRLRQRLTRAAAAVAAVGRLHQRRHDRVPAWTSAGASTSWR